MSWRSSWRLDDHCRDVWLRGNDFADTETIEGVTRAPGAWTDHDVRLVLEACCARWTA